MLRQKRTRELKSAHGHMMSPLVHSKCWDRNKIQKNKYRYPGVCYTVAEFLKTSWQILYRLSQSNQVEASHPAWHNNATTGQSTIHNKLHSKAVIKLITTEKMSLESVVWNFTERTKHILKKESMHRLDINLIYRKYRHIANIDFIGIILVFKYHFLRCIDIVSVTSKISTISWYFIILDDTMGSDPSFSVCFMSNFIHRNIHGLQANKDELNPLLLSYHNSIAVCLSHDLIKFNDYCVYSVPAHPLWHFEPAKVDPN